MSLDGHITVLYYVYYMVMISEKKLGDKELKKLESLLERTLKEQIGHGDLAKTLRELLTESEYDTILRRLAAMLALDAGNSYYSLRNSLGMSIRTLKRIEKITKKKDSLIIHALRNLSNHKSNNKDRTMAGHENKVKIKTLEETLDNVFGGLPKYGESYPSYRNRQLRR